MKHNSLPAIGFFISFSSSRRLRHSTTLSIRTSSRHTHTVESSGPVDLPSRCRLGSAEVLDPASISLISASTPCYLGASRSLASYSTSSSSLSASSFSGRVRTWRHSILVLHTLAATGRHLPTTSLWIKRFCPSPTIFQIPTGARTPRFESDPTPCRSVDVSSGPLENRKTFS